jgi:hypothetical protein
MVIRNALLNSHVSYLYRLLLFAIIAGQALPAGAQNGVPSQFIAKMYTEALGRAPDQLGWSEFADYFRISGCGTRELSLVGQVFYASHEFLSDYTDNEAKVLALYRGALNRDADQSGLAYYASLLNSGVPWVSVVHAVFTSSEFIANTPSICNAKVPDYGFGTQVPPTPTPGDNGFTGTESQLQALLSGASSGSTIYLAQKAIIPLTSTLVIPSGVSLKTYGEPTPHSYALMGRLVRATTFDGPNISIQGGGVLRNVWVDGQRNVLGYYKVSGGAGDNANVVTLSGSNTMVASNKLSDPQGGSNFFSVGGYVGTPCSNQIVNGNLVTAYSSLHGFSQNADGLTMSCEGLDIENNDIVDVSDIGVVLFAVPGITQRSRIANNTIVSAGISMNAPISSDPSTGNPGGSVLDYSGAVFSNNTLWTGPSTTFDFGIEAGAREFFFLPNKNSDGFGAAYLNNTTGWLTARVRAGIAVAGMLEVTIANDETHPLNFLPVTFESGTPAAACPSSSVVAEASDGHASGTYPTPTFDGDFDGCVKGFVPSSETLLTESSLEHDPKTQTYNGTLRVQNTGSETIVGPFHILFGKLTYGVTLDNASGEVAGVFYLNIPAIENLEPGQSASVVVQFSDPSSSPISYIPVLYSGKQ